MSDERPIEEIMGWDPVVSSSHGKGWIPPGSLFFHQFADVDDLAAWLRAHHVTVGVVADVNSDFTARCLRFLGSYVVASYVGTGLTIRDALTAAVRKVAGGTP